MRRALFALLLLWTCGASVPSARAGAWLREPGGWYVRTAWMHHTTRDRWDCEGNRAPAEPFGGRYREQLVFGYVEWGATERLTLVGSLGYKDAGIVGAQVPDYGTRTTTDLRLGTRVGLHRGSWPVSAEFTLAAPTYPRTDPTQPVGGREQFLPGGTGRIESEARLMIGRSLFPLPFYVNLDLGYRARGGAFGDQWLLAFETGAQWRRLFAKSELRTILPTGDLCSSASAGAVTFHERNWRWAPELAVRIGERAWLGAGANVPLSARNALQGTQWSLSLSWQRPGRPQADTRDGR